MLNLEIYSRLRLLLIHACKFWLGKWILRCGAGVCTFPKVINPKENIRIQLLLELAYCDVTVTHVSHYTVRTTLINLIQSIKY